MAASEARRRERSSAAHSRSKARVCPPASRHPCARCRSLFHPPTPPPAAPNTTPAPRSTLHARSLPTSSRRRRPPPAVVLLLSPSLCLCLHPPPRPPSRPPSLCAPARTTVLPRRLPPHREVCPTLRGPIAACQPSLAPPANRADRPRAVSASRTPKLRPAPAAARDLDTEPPSQPSTTMTTAVANPPATSSAALAPARHHSPRHFAALAPSRSSRSPPNALPESANKRSRSNASPTYAARSNSNERSSASGKISPNS